MNYNKFIYYTSQHVSTPNHLIDDDNYKKCVDKTQQIQMKLKHNKNTRENENIKQSMMINTDN